MRAWCFFLAASWAAAMGGCHTVMFDSDPPGARVYSDGEYWGTTPCSHTWVLGQKAGAFYGVMTLPGYELSDCPTLARGPAVLQDESLLSSAPAGAQIYVNGTLVGTSPMFRALPFPQSIRAVWPKEAQAARPRPAPAQGGPPPPARPAPLPGVRNRIALLVGISEYQFRGKWELSNLRYAAKDAEAFAEHLRSEQGGRFDQVLLLTDRQATTKNIKAALREDLRGAQRDDLVVIFWSGHGSPDPYEAKGLYLITHDTDPEHMASTGYAMEDFKADVSRLEARRVVILADTCHSAGLSDPRQGLRGPGQNRIVEGLKGVYVAPEGSQPQGPMWMIFTSCESGEFSRETGDLDGGHGVFTHFLLQGLKGQADLPKSGGNGDGKVTLGECVEYTRDQVKRYTGNQQHPDTAGQFDRGLPMSEVPR